MPQIARITDPTHAKDGYWFLVIRDGSLQVAGNVLDGSGTIDTEGVLISKTSLGERFQCPDVRLDRVKNGFKSFPVRIYGKKTQSHQSGEYEIKVAQGDALPIQPASAIKAGQGMSRNQGSSNINMNSGSAAGTAVLDRPEVTEVRPVVKKSVPVKTAKRTQPSSVGLSGSATDGAPVVSVERIALFLDLLSVNQAVMIWGPSGVGKSEAIQDWAHERGKMVYDWRLSMMDPTLMQGVGVPDFNDQRTKFFPLDMIPSKPNCVLLLDEITTAPPSIQALAYQITLDRMIGSVPLPPDCMVVCAGNRTTDRGVSYQMPSPLANRLFHLTVKEDIASWRNWANSRGVDPRIVSFLTQRPEFLHKMDATTSGSAWPSPRSWAACNRILNSSLSAADQGIGIASLVGVIAAREFIKHCDGYDRATKRVEDILNGTARDYVETDPSRAQTVVVALVANATSDSDILENIIKWLRHPRFNDEYRNLGLRGLEARFGADTLQTIPSYHGLTPEDQADVLPF